MRRAGTGVVAAKPPMAAADDTPKLNVEDIAREVMRRLQVNKVMTESAEPLDAYLRLSVNLKVGRVYSAPSDSCIRTARWDRRA